MTNNDELDRWLRENTRPSQEPPAPDGWDTPSEQVWKGLRAGLDRRRKRRRGFLWTGALLLAITAGVAGWLSMTGEVLPAGDFKVVRPAAGTPVTPMPAGTVAESPFNTTPDAGNTAPSRIENVKGTSHKPINPPINTAVTPSSNPIRMTYKTTARLTFSSENTPGRGSKGRLPTLDSTPFAEPSPSSSPAKNAEIAGLAIQTETTAILPSPTSSPELTPGEAVAQFETPGAGRPALPETTRIVPDRLDFLPTNQPALLENRERPIEGTTPAPASIPEIRPLRRKTGAYVAAMAGALYTSRLLRLPNGTLSVGRESGAWTIQAGALAGLPLSRRWALEAGLQWTAIHLRAERTIAFSYSQNTEQYDAQGFLYRNSAQETIETSFGAVQMRMDFGREPNRPIGDQALLRLTLQTDEQVRYVRIPLTLRWTAGATGPWQWSLAGGIGLGIEAGYQLQMTAARADRPGVRAIRAGIQGRARGLSPLMADLQLGAALDLNLTPNWSLRLAPEFRYGLSAMYRRGALRSKAVSGGVQLGVVYEGL